MEKILLIVDDNPEIIEVLEALLGGLFDKVVSATSVENAQKSLGEFVFSFIMLDIHLEKRNGAEIVKYLIENPSNKNNGCPVMILSGIINANFIQKNRDRFAGIIMKPFESSHLIEAVKNILNGKKVEHSYDDIPIPECALPFPIPELHEKVGKVLDHVKKNNKLKQLFSELKINRNGDDFVMSHIGMLINISTGISNKLEWNTDKTLEKFVYAAYLHDMALADRPDLARINGTAVEMDLLKENMAPRDHRLVLEHANMAAKKIEEIIEIPQDVALMIKQHHELPRENGFPGRISSVKITPLSTVFIVSHDLVNYIMAHPKWTVRSYLMSVKLKFKGPHFAKVLSALSEMS